MVSSEGRYRNTVPMILIFCSLHRLEVWLEEWEEWGTGKYFIQTTLDHIVAGIFFKILSEVFLRQ